MIIILALEIFFFACLSVDYIYHFITSTSWEVEIFLSLFGMLGALTIFGILTAFISLSIILGVIIGHFTNASVKSSHIIALVFWTSTICYIIALIAAAGTSIHFNKSRELFFLENSGMYFLIAGLCLATAIINHLIKTKLDKKHNC